MENNYSSESQRENYDNFRENSSDYYQSGVTQQESFSWLNYEPSSDPEYQKIMIKKTGKKMYTALGAAYLAFTLATMFFPNIILYFAENIIGKSLSTSADAIMIINYCAMYLIGFPLLIIILNIKKQEDYIYLDQRNKISLGFLDMAKLFVASYAVMQFFNLVTVLLKNLIIEKLGDFSPTDFIIMDDNSPVVGFIIIVIIAPIMEEIVFRWLPYKKVGKMGEKSYVLYTAIVFGLFHMNFPQTFYATALGVVFGSIMYRTGKVRYSIILHILVNLTGFILSRLSYSDYSELLGKGVIVALLFILAGILTIITTSSVHGRQIYNLGSSFLKFRYAIGNIPTIILLLLLTAATIVSIATL